MRHTHHPDIYRLTKRSPCPGSSIVHTLPNLALVLLFLLLAACNTDNTPPTPTAQQLISRAQAAIQKVTSYHFNLVVDNPGSGSSLVIKSADGDIAVPDKLKANADAVVLNNIVKVQIISIKDKQYITDPITGQWITTTELLDPRTLSDPQKGVVAILGHIQNPSTPTNSKVDNTDCWNINGRLDTRYLTGITGGGEPAGSTVAITTCIGKSDNLPYLIRINGVAIKGDTDKTVRTFKLSKFGEALTIVAPI